MERQLTATNISSLSPDAIRKIALDLTFDEISKLCATSKKFNKLICEDTYFWRSKILADFEITKSEVNNIRLPSLKAKYLDLLADKVEDDAAQLYSVFKEEKFSGEE
jgi:hypothetical protein